MASEKYTKKIMHCLLFIACLFLLNIAYAENIYAGVAFMDSEGNLCFTTNDKIKTSSIWYKTEGIDITECAYPYDDTKGNIISPHKHFVRLPFNEEGTTWDRETSRAGGRETNKFRCSRATLVEGMNATCGDWGTKLEKTLAGEEGYGPFELKFDCVMWVYHGQRHHSGPYVNDPTVYEPSTDDSYGLGGGQPHSDKAKANPYNIAHAEPWANRFGLASHYDNWWIVGGGKKVATAGAMPTYKEKDYENVPSDTTPILYHTNNKAEKDMWDNIYKSIPSGESFMNGYEASSWRGECDPVQRIVSSDSGTGGSKRLNGVDYRKLSRKYTATWWDGKTWVDEHDNPDDPDEVTGRHKKKFSYTYTAYYNDKQCLDAEDLRPMSFFVSYDYFKKLATYNLDTTTVFNDAFPAREILYGSNVIVSYKFTGLNTDQNFLLQTIGAYGQGLKPYVRSGDIIYADNRNHIQWATDVGAFTKDKSVFSYPNISNLSEIKTKISNQWLEDKEGLINKIKHDTKSKNDELIVKDGKKTEIFMKGNVYNGAREVHAGERSAYDSAYSSAGSVNEGKDNLGLWYPSGDFPSAHSVYGYGKNGNMTFSNGGTPFQTNASDESIDDIPTDVDNGRYYTGIQVDYRNALIDGLKPKYTEGDPSPIHGGNGTNADAVSSGIQNDHVWHEYNVGNPDASIFVHTPVVSPFSIRNGEGENIAFYEGGSVRKDKNGNNLTLSDEIGQAGTQLQDEAYDPDANVQLRLDEGYLIDFTTMLEEHLSKGEYGIGYGKNLVRVGDTSYDDTGRQVYELIDTDGNVVDTVYVDETDGTGISDKIKKNKDEFFSKFDKYVENKWVRFPFDVEYGGVYFKANTWILVQSPKVKSKRPDGGAYNSGSGKKENETKLADYLKPAEAKKGTAATLYLPTSNNHWRKMPFYIPSYAEETAVDAGAEIEVLVEAINIDGLYGGDHNEGTQTDSETARKKAKVAGWTTKEELRSKFPHTHWPDIWEDEANLEHRGNKDYDEGAHYVAYSSMSCQLSGHIYDFTVVGVSDAETFMYVDTGTHVTSDVVPFCRYKMDKKVGTRNRFGLKDGGQYIRYRADGSTNNTALYSAINSTTPFGAQNVSVMPWPYVNTLPFTRGKSNCWTDGGFITKGTLLSYSLRTMANLYNDDDSIVIQPSFRFLKEKGAGATVYRTNPDESLLESTDPADWAKYNKIKVYYDDPDRKGRFIEYVTSGSDNYEGANSSGSYNYKMSLKNTMFDQSYYTEDDIDRGVKNDGSLSDRYWRWGNWLQFSAQEEGISTDRYLNRENYGYSLAQINLPTELRMLSGEWEELARNVRRGLAASDFSTKSRYTQGKYSWAWFLGSSARKAGNTKAGRYAQGEIDDLTHDSMQTWYGQYYVPANIYIIVLDDLPALVADEPYIADCWTIDLNSGKITDFDLNKYLAKRKEAIRTARQTNPHDTRREGITGDEPMFITDKGYLILNFDIKSYMDGDPHLQYYGLGTESVWAKEKGRPTPDDDPTPGKDPVPPSDDDEFGSEDGDVAIIDMNRSLLNRYESAIFNIN